MGVEIGSEHEHRFWLQCCSHCLDCILLKKDLDELARVGPQVSFFLPADCHQYTNRSCEECLKNVTCLWCASSKRCMEYPVRRILPPADLCELRSARWGVCWGKCQPGVMAV
ncbi:hypothetical protein Nmel_011544 [Mimus melanotis]